MTKIKKYEIRPEMINIVSGQIDRISDIGFIDGKYYLWAMENDKFAKIDIQVIGWKEETQMPTVEDYDFSNELIWAYAGRTDDIFWFAEDPILKQMEAYDEE